VPRDRRSQIVASEDVAGSLSAGLVEPQTPDDEAARDAERRSAMLAASAAATASLLDQRRWPVDSLYFSLAGRSLDTRPEAVVDRPRSKTMGNFVASSDLAPAADEEAPKNRDARATIS
jgi:hypothetical protein